MNTPTLPAENTLLLTAERTRLVYMQAPISNATVFVVAGLFYLILREYTDSVLIDWWVLALAATASLRLLLWLDHQRHPEKRPTADWLRRYTIASGLVGASWSIVVPLIYLEANLTVAIGLSMLLFGVVSSAVVILAVHLPAFVLYTFPQVITLAITLLHFEGKAHLMLGVSVAIYLVMLTLFVRNVHRNLTHAILLQAQNSHLVRELGAEVAEREARIEASTTQLRSRNEELMREVAERKLAQARLQASEERFELAMRGANDGLFDWDLRDNSVYYSPRWKSMLGYADPDLPNELATWEELVEPDDRERALQMLDDYVCGRRDNYRLEFRMRHRDGHWVEILARAFLVRDAEGKAKRVVGTHVDITEKKRQEQRILHQAHYDDLTDLPNRFLAIDRLRQLLKAAERRSGKVGVIFLDLDGFKRINDTQGHAAGDHMLIQAAARLQGAVRDGDSVCRLGGDEFLVLLPDIARAEDTQPVAKHLLAQFRDPFELDGRAMLVTASAGIAIYPDDGATTSELLRNADMAMYHAKEHGRNMFHFFTESMNREILRRVVVEARMHGALERGDFTIVYQPVIDLRGRTVIGGEALLRWHDAELGDVSPIEFIPIAEQTGHIVEIGRYVLRRTLRRLANWQGLPGGKGLRLAVNLSPRQFRDPDIVRAIERALVVAGVDPCSLILEITENVLLSELQHVERSLKQLRSLGVGIAMDDFGTGYSSLSYLRHYPFDTLKVDRSFVSDVADDPADRELVMAAILMAHGLGLQVVAEGVETAEQLDFLDKQGCDYVQGYYFHPPLPADEFEALLGSSV